MRRVFFNDGVFVLRIIVQLSFLNGIRFYLLKCKLVAHLETIFHVLQQSNNHALILARQKTYLVSLE
jgi:hypothetical protein